MRIYIYIYIYIYILYISVYTAFYWLIAVATSYNFQLEKCAFTNQARAATIQGWLQNLCREPKWRHLCRTYLAESSDVISNL